MHVSSRKVPFFMRRDASSRGLGCARVHACEKKIVKTLANLMRTHIIRQYGY